ncbi:penicillin-binding transpeptidase domain-containing protein [Brumimicrobium oceani]|uniref:Peptidoglycan glycosyltransferase n=1 Tax=Brumimicrobium oceani TaxID=2100725 RepID=A0A2U2XCW2_9FLAO|nr:penicillin-binding transpeptidase domain-containing protein [Brumimicrobium oceani]PWH85618.1 peptidoglycan glycosyltransferase [Brumimicrobium oceani]
MNLENRRLVFILLFVFVGVVFTARLFYMQVIDDKWIERAGEVSKKKITIKPPRGILYDRNGEKIVANKTYYNLMFVEDDIDSLDTLAFANLIGFSVDSVHMRFAEIRKELDRKTRSKKTGNDTVVNDYRSYLPHAFLKELSADEISEIAMDLSDFQGFYEEPMSMRDYPYPYGANIYGYLNEISGPELNADRRFYNVGDFIGRSGLEKYYEYELRGKKGTKVILTSSRGKLVDNFAGGKLDTNAQQGPPLHLGIDIILQAYGEELMKNKLGSVVAIEPSTGEILAMVSAPSYNPNLMVGTRNIRTNYRKLYKDTLKPFYPRPLAAEYPPGSIFKVVNALIGLQEGVITEDASFPCTQSWVGCHNHPPANSVAKAIQFSCNPYFYYEVKKIIQQGKHTSNFKDAAEGLALWEKYMHSFGFGIKPETDIYGLRSGVIPNVAFYNHWYGEFRWAFSTIRSNSIGQGEVKMTPLQMANLAAIVANDGFYYEPHLVKSIGTEGPQDKFLVKKQTMIDAKHFASVKEGMRAAVNEPHGTARRARIKDIVVSGKTGTAQNPHGEDHSVFMAFAPFDNPKIAIAVFVENAGFGGTWAAPIASLMMEKYLTGEIADTLKEKRILEKHFTNINE